MTLLHLQKTQGTSKRPGCNKKLRFLFKVFQAFESHRMGIVSLIVWAQQNIMARWNSIDQWSTTGGRVKTLSELQLFFEI